MYGFSLAIMTMTQWHASCWNFAMDPIYFVSSLSLKLLKAQHHVICFPRLRRTASAKFIPLASQNAPPELRHFVMKDGKILLVDFAQAVAHRCNNVMPLTINQHFCISREGA
jgi:hypothetical protein